jgi:uncharacterized protein (TIGR02246 family)
MHWSARPAALVAALILVFAWARPIPAASPDNEAAIREVVRRYVDAREQRDPAVIGPLFNEDADQLTSSGEWRRGRNELVPGTLASSARTGGTRAITIERVRFLTPDAAIADGRYEISGLAGGGRRLMWTTIVLTRQDNAWRIAAIRNMLPATAPPARGDRP